MFIPSAFVHEQATVIGDVWINEDVYIGPGAVLRGDWGRITVEKGSNVQENCTIHVFPGKDVLLKESSHIGHGAVIHGATIEPNSFDWNERSNYGRCRYRKRVYRWGFDICKAGHHRP